MPIEISSLSVLRDQTLTKSINMLLSTKPVKEPQLLREQPAQIAAAVLFGRREGLGGAEVASHAL